MLVLLVTRCTFTECTYSCALALFLCPWSCAPMATFMFPGCFSSCTRMVASFLEHSVHLCGIPCTRVLWETTKGHSVCPVSRCIIYPCSKYHMLNFIGQSLRVSRCTRYYIQWNFVENFFFAYFTNWSELTNIETATVRVLHVLAHSVGSGLLKQNHKNLVWQAFSGNTLAKMFMYMVLQYYTCTACTASPTFSESLVVQTTVGCSLTSVTRPSSLCEGCGLRH